MFNKQNNFGETTHVSVHSRLIIATHQFFATHRWEPLTL